ncbi:hypothetical protein P9236_15335 [Mesorhizobium sp. WSM4884]|nr:hypothetical protein [Mesorhizobium sp. WSM4884]
MIKNQHPKSKKPSDADIGSDPGIGTSKGTFRRRRRERHHRYWRNQPAEKGADE